jgi:hypothetical protein
MSSNVCGAGAFRALSVLAVSLVVGCKTMTQSEIKFLETRELDLPYDQAYQAAANGLFSLGFPIDHSDKGSGILSAKINKKAAKMSVTFLLILPMPTVGEGTNDEAVTFMLTSVNPTLTQLRMKVVRNGKPIVDRKMMTKIWQTIEREAMLETRPVQERTAQPAPTSATEVQSHAPP